MQKNAKNIKQSKEKTQNRGFKERQRSGEDKREEELKWRRLKQWKSLREDGGGAQKSESDSELRIILMS